MQKFFRFNSRQYIRLTQKEFFLNFLECHRTFQAQQRFAGTGVCSGFFLADSIPTSVAEIAHYSRLSVNNADLNPENIHGCFFGQAWLSVEMNIDQLRLLDLKRPDNILSFLLSRLPRNSQLRTQLQRTRSALDIILLILTPEEGGNFLTDWIGMKAREEGFSGILFPSVRCLDERVATFREPVKYFPGRFSHRDLQTIRLNDEMSSANSALQQLTEEFNLVLFSGTKIVTTIQRYSCQVDGRLHGSVTNPLFGASVEQVEFARISYARDRKMSAEVALREGFVSDTEFVNEYSCSVLQWIFD